MLTRQNQLVDPGDDSLLYAVGNVETRYARLGNGPWFSMDNTEDKSFPHADNRNLYFYNATKELLLVCDGGIFARSTPVQNGTGRWRSLNGDIGTFETVDAAWDPHWRRFAAGAQDNGSILSAQGAKLPAVGVQFSGGDGQLTFFDTTRVPARAYTTSQYLSASGSVGQITVCDTPDKPVNFNITGLFPYFVQGDSVVAASSSC